MYIKWTQRRQTV